MTSFPEFLAGARDDVDGALDRLLPPVTAAPTRLHEAMRYSIFAGGKRVRPGLLLLAGEIWSAPRAALLPGAAAMEMILTGDPIDAPRAYELGLVNQVVPEGDLLEAAKTLAGRITANAPLAVQESEALEQLNVLLIFQERPIERRDQALTLRRPQNFRRDVLSDQQFKPIQELRRARFFFHARHIPDFIKGVEGFL